MAEFIDYTIEPRSPRTLSALSIVCSANFVNALFCHPMVNPMWDYLGRWQLTAWWFSGSVFSALIITPVLVILVACLVFRGRLADWRHFTVCVVAANASLFAWAHLWYVIFTD